jgi:hypothetical protein
MFRKIDLLVSSIVLLTAVALPLIMGVGHAQSKCKPVNGHIVSELLTGPACTSPVDLCTSGRFIGGINGAFVFIATSLTEHAQSALRADSKRGRLGPSPQPPISGLTV